MGACTVVVTGASGSCYGMRLIEQLVLAGHDVSVVFTEAGREVSAFELGFQYYDRLGEAKGVDVRELLQRELPNLDDVTKDERRAVFLHEEARRARWARENITPRPAGRDFIARSPNRSSG